ncbi:MAG: hypothetical protein NWE94_00235 [Candidatus Bathyarchaeota archaeon]|nr:hypothetical protein [Candidatus Bathyarchaeota archaeon]
MNSTMILDCQTQAASPCCEACIARKTCVLRMELAREEDAVAEVVELAAVRR